MVKLKNIQFATETLIAPNCKNKKWKRKCISFAVKHSKQREKYILSEYSQV